MNRNDAVSMDIKDPNILNDETTIVMMKEIDDKLFSFKTESVYEVQPAEGIDPENKHPDTSHTYKKVLDIGTKSPYLARVILQFEPIIKSAIVDENIQNRLIKHIWEMNKELVTCCKIFESLKEEVNILAPKCNDIVQQSKERATTPALPQVIDLENRVNTFFTSGKKFLIETFKIFVILFNMTVAKNKEASFKSHSRWIGNHFGTTHNLAQIIEQDITWIRLLSESRNALEHPSQKNRVEIKNFTLIPGNKFIFPAWSYNLSDKKLGEVNNLNLVNDLDVFLDNMLCFFEEIMLQSIQQKLNENNNTLLYLEKLKEEKIDATCPIQYGITYKVLN
jgi:hypothetical protein